MKLVVGLGNPELRYMLTRHNAGFWVVDEIATKYGASYQRYKDLHSDIAKVQAESGALLLAKPQTYMNLSGRAVQAILHWYKLENEDLIVVHDDVALPLGKIRIQSGGGAGGQHGIENTIQMLGGAKNFDRIKIGVGPDPGGDRRADYVLSPIPHEDNELKEKVLQMAVQAISLWLKEGPKAAANRFNGMDLRPPPPPPPVLPPVSADATVEQSEPDPKAPLRGEV